MALLPEFGRIDCAKARSWSGHDGTGERRNVDMREP